MSDIEKLVHAMESEPALECVVKRDLHADLGIDAGPSCAATQRSVRSAIEIAKAPEQNTGYRTSLFVFSPTKEAA